MKDLSNRYSVVNYASKASALPGKLRAEHIVQIVFDHDPGQYPFSTTSDNLGAYLHTFESDVRIAVPYPFIGGHLFPCQVVSIPVRPPAQSSTETSVNEQLVHRIIAQSVLLKGTVPPQLLLTGVARKWHGNGQCDGY